MTNGQLKDLFAASATKTGEADESWRSGGTDRMYFFDPNDKGTAGSVDVLRNEPNDYVKIELYIAAKRAAEVIALVTGATESIEARLRRAVEQETVETIQARHAAARAEADQAIAAELRQQLINTQELSDIERADIARMAELDVLCKEERERERLAEIEALAVEQAAERDADEEL